MFVMWCFLFNTNSIFALVVADRRQQGQKADRPDLQKYVAGRCWHVAWGSVLALDVSYRLLRV